MPRAGVGLDAPAVHVEVHLANALPGLTLVGLPETAVKESRERVRGALVNAGFDFPNTRRITLNLDPADLPKEGGRFDLPIALGVLAASGQILLEALEGMECAGELALDGKLRSVPGVLPFALATRRAKKALIIRRACADEAALAGDLPVLPADTLWQVVAHLLEQEKIPPHKLSASVKTTAPVDDLADVRGQQQARRALEVAAAGGITCCLPARRAPAKPCWPVACQVFCRRFPKRMHWESLPCVRFAGYRWKPTGVSGHLGSPTTAPAAPPWLVAVVIFSNCCDRA